MLLASTLPLLIKDYREERQAAGEPKMAHTTDMSLHTSRTTNEKRDANISQIGIKCTGIGASDMGRARGMLAYAKLPTGLQTPS